MDTRNARIRTVVTNTDDIEMLEQFKKECDMWPLNSVGEVLVSPEIEKERLQKFIDCTSHQHIKLRVCCVCQENNFEREMTMST